MPIIIAAYNNNAIGAETVLLALTLLIGERHCDHIQFYRNTKGV